MNLLDLMRAPMRVVPVEPDGPVLHGPAQETLVLPQKGMAWNAARIELHPFPEGWAWSVSFCTNEGGHSYKVGRKWGRFAATRDDALHYAVRELCDRIARDINPSPALRRIAAWALQQETT